MRKKMRRGYHPSSLPPLCRPASTTPLFCNNRQSSPIFQWSDLCCVCAAVCRNKINQYLPTGPLNAPEQHRIAQKQKKKNCCSTKSCGSRCCECNSRSRLPLSAPVCSVSPTSERGSSTQQWSGYPLGLMLKHVSQQGLRVSVRSSSAEIPAHGALYQRLDQYVRIDWIVKGLGDQWLARSSMC